MECIKCKNEISKDSKFCSNCGKEIEKEVMKFTANDNLKLCSKLWYIIGFMKWSSMNGDKKSFKEFEEILKKDYSGMLDWYKEVVQHWEDWAISDDEDLKEKVRLKRASVPEAKGVQKKK